MRAFALWLTTFLILAAAPLRAGEDGPLPYDLLFRTGTLDALPADRVLGYTREVRNAADPEAAARESGRVELARVAETPDQARLTFRQGEKYRTIGEFPAGVGNPLILYFVETVVRDMAHGAGGSPFYIRNRLKEALVEPAVIDPTEIRRDGATVTGRKVTLRPFEDDPNRDRMKGFGALTLEVTMSDDVPGWYHSLRAEVPDPAGDALLYSSTLTLEGGDEAADVAEDGQGGAEE